MTKQQKPSPTLTPEEQDEVLAAELALGLVEGDEAQALLGRLALDPGFARRFREWQKRSAALAEELTPVMAPARTRQRIREELGHAVAPLSKTIDSRIRWWQRPLPLVLVLLAVLGAVLALVLI